MKMKKKGGGGGANWMDTYGDMVTLLLCFFVLLYSISTMDENKWKALVQSFNPDAIPSSTVTSGSDGPSAEDFTGSPEEYEKMLEDQQEEIDAAIAALYEALKEYTEQSEAGQYIEVTKGDGYVFVSFNEAVFFDPDKAALREDGIVVLQSVCEILSQASEYIDEVDVLGHTAQASPDRANNPATDRTLASNRATNVVVYIQEHSTIPGSRLVSSGYGQWRPIDNNDSKESRSHNRRVELLVTGLDVMNELGDSIQQYNSLHTGGATGETGASVSIGTDTGANAPAGTDTGANAPTGTDTGANAPAGTDTGANTPAGTNDGGADADAGDNAADTNADNGGDGQTPPDASP